MSFTLQDVKDFAETLCRGATIPGPDLLIWANQFIRMEVGSLAWTEDTEKDLYSAAVADTWYALPEGFVSVLEMADSDDNPYYSYQIRSNKIRFSTVGAYTMTYNSYPAKMTDFKTAVALPDIFQYPMSFFIAFTFAGRVPSDKDMMNLAVQLQAKYKDALNKAFSEMEMNNQAESFRPKMKW